MQKISAHNYDLAFKEAFSLFENKTLDFLGLHLPKITGFLETEFAEIETHDDYMDLNFRLEDGSILHLEEETHLSEEDLIRFAHYDLRLYSRYKTPVHTVVLTPSMGKPRAKPLNTGTIHYTVIQLILGGKNADILMADIEAALREGQSVNELELIFLPLMQSTRSSGELLKDTIRLEKLLPDLQSQTKVMGLTLVMANRIVEKELIDTIWEEIRMLKVIQYAEQKGMELGIEKGMEKGREEGKIFLIKRQLLKKFGYLSPEILNEIDFLDEPALDTLSMEILDMQKPEDIKRFITRT